jgi:hypothetical protein
VAEVAMHSDVQQKGHFCSSLYFTYGLCDACIVDLLLSEALFSTECPNGSGLGMAILSHADVSMFLDSS